MKIAPVSAATTSSSRSALLELFRTYQMGSRSTLEWSFKSFGAMLLDVP